MMSSQRCLNVHLMSNPVTEGQSNCTKMSRKNVGKPFHFRHARVVCGVARCICQSQSLTRTLCLLFAYVQYFFPTVVRALVIVIRLRSWCWQIFNSLVKTAIRRMPDFQVTHYLQRLNMNVLVLVISGALRWRKNYRRFPGSDLHHQACWVP